jgi:hypothetical protein
LEWCKVFGSSNEPTHWSSHIPIEEQDTFRKGLLKQLSLSNEEWKTYWNSVKDYRDNHIAHHQRNSNVIHYPNLDHALIACFCYYHFLINELRMLKINGYPNNLPDNLEEYYQRFLAQVAKFSRVAYRSTMEIEETVY